MRSKPLFFFVLFLIGLFVFFKIDHALRQGVLSLGDRIKGVVLGAKDWILEGYYSHFNQAEMIAELMAQVGELEKIKLQKQEIQSELDRILKFYNLPPSVLSNLTPIRAISYVEIGNYHRVWLEEYGAKKEGFFGLIVNDSTIGIAKIDEDGRMIGYLNGDALCSYGVFIGESRSLGIIKGEENRPIVDFIPLGSKIAIGDEVVTNGMDDIFFPNIPVGKVTKIFERNGYLSAEISPYVPNLELGYMWLLDRSVTRD